MKRISRTNLMADKVISYFNADIGYCYHLYSIKGNSPDAGLVDTSSMYPFKGEIQEIWRFPVIRVDEQRPATPPSTHRRSDKAQSSVGGKHSSTQSFCSFDLGADF